MTTHEEMRQQWRIDDPDWKGRCQGERRDGKQCRKPRLGTWTRESPFCWVHADQEVPWNDDPPPSTRTYRQVVEAIITPDLLAGLIVLTVCGR